MTSESQQQPQTAPHIALLAPVPLQHLLSGQSVLQTQGKVAFGSDNYDLFSRLDKERTSKPVDVYIRASHLGESRGGDPEPFWRARYIGFVLKEMGGHPNGMKFRPRSTITDTPSLVYWEVDSLKPVGRWNETRFTGFEKKRNYESSFMPEGPILIRRPEENIS